MRILLGMVVMLMMSAGPLGDTYSQTYSREAMASQTPPPAAPKCEIQDARDCYVSKRKHEGIRWKAPANENRNVCFDAPYPFAKQEFHIPRGGNEDSGPIVLQPPPTTGREFKYRTGKNPCPNPSPDKIRNSAKVIVED
ncbi:MAG: hypothetical protein WA274_18060 [Candidatus Acidiferrales bacterium]